MTRFFVCALGLIAGLTLAVATAADAPKDTVKLFNGKDFTGWKKFADPNAKIDLDKLWTVQDGIIVCEGSVNGYLITEKEYEDYVLELQWRWGKKVTSQRNSGVFVHVSGPDKIWPKAVEAQLLINHAGDFWLVSGFKLDVDKARKDKNNDIHYTRMKDNVEKPIGEWNQYKITCKGDIITLNINGQDVNVGKNAESRKGKILLQSEGAEIHFRDVVLKPVK